jgi:tetratricopeptide (TPR) repeat protein
MPEKGKQWCLKIHRNSDKLPLKPKIMANWLYALYFETVYDQIKYLKQYLATDEMSPMHHYLLGVNYNTLFQFDNGVAELERSLELTDNLNSKPLWISSYTDLGYAYHETGQFKKEERLYSRAEADYPNNNLLLYRQAILAIATGKTKEGEDYISRYRTILRAKSASESVISTSIAMIYDAADSRDKAEEYYRKALSEDPENPIRMNNLAYLLIDKNRNLTEGTELIEKAYRLSPEDAYILDTKGWGLYKLGRYKEALEFLEKSVSAFPYYDHETYLHLEAARKACESQKQTN